MKTRTKQLYWLIFLTAVTMTPQYALQGWLATGHGPSEIDDLFWYVDAAAWSLRAIIEAAALVYLFSTQARTEREQRLLTGFEIALIALIVVTLGPALYSVGEGKAMTDAIWEPVRLLWSFAIAAYAPLMLGAVGFAFKVQVGDQSHPLHDDAIPAQSEPKPTAQPAWVEELRPVQPKPEAQPNAPGASTTQPGDPVSASTEERRAAVPGLLKDGMSRTQIAELFGVAPSTISRDVKALNGSI